MKKLMHHRPIMVIVTLSLAIMSCQKEEVVFEREYPRLDISEEIIMSDSGATFEASFLTQNVDILDKGFVWADGVFPVIENESHISLGAGTGTGTFSSMGTFDLVDGKGYYIHAYAITSEYLVYSKAISFISSTNGLEYSLDRFLPVRGRANDTLVLFGSNLSYHKERIEVLFGNVKAEILCSTDSTITVTVPVVEISKAQISVTINKVQKAFKDFFFVELKS